MTERIHVEAKLLPLPEPPAPKKRGRPKGRKNDKTLAREAAEKAAAAEEITVVDEAPLAAADTSGVRTLPVVRRKEAVFSFGPHPNPWIPGYQRCYIEYCEAPACTRFYAPPEPFATVLPPAKPEPPRALGRFEDGFTSWFFALFWGSVLLQMLRDWWGS